MAASSNIPIVLRVKRKRTEDPADALVLQSKIPKSDSDSLTGLSSDVFQLCGSIDGSASDRSNILDIVRSYKDRSKQSKVNPLSRLSLEEQREERRCDKKKSSSNQRYKLLSSLRCTEDDTSQPSSDMIHVYDAVTETPLEQLSLNTSSVGEITCNSSIMTREKVTLSGDDDFVIDIYYGNRIDIGTIEDMVVCPYEVELVHDIIDTGSGEERYDDEDDSNDESNWRNDYPDEDDWRDGDNDDESSDSHSFDDYRHRDAYYDEYEDSDQDY